MAKRKTECYFCTKKAQQIINVDGEIIHLCVPHFKEVRSRWLDLDEAAEQGVQWMGLLSRISKWFGAIAHH